MKTLQILNETLSGSALDFKSKLNEKSEAPTFCLFFFLFSYRITDLSEELAAVTSAKDSGCLDHGFFTKADA